MLQSQNISVDCLNTSVALVSWGLSIKMTCAETFNPDCRSIPVY